MSNNKNIFVKSVMGQILAENGIAMTSSELKILVEDRIHYEIPTERWSQIVEETKQVTGAILED